EGSTEMEAGQMDVVNSDILSVLQGKPGLKLEITGFAEDQPGGQGATDKLAMARASAIRNYLLNRSIAPGRLTVRAKGDDTGIEPRDRVEVYFSR
ncbi:MAG: OmpA family protein, partial [Alphaproteobacteria bacterium]|nr:OmpA family protein [Alphaproteobacteria bacterium]